MGRFFMFNLNKNFFLGMGIGEKSVSGRIKYINKKEMNCLNRRKIKLDNLLEMSLQVNKKDILLLDDITNLDYLLLLESAGVISKSGGATSHTAVILREIGKSAIIGLGEDVNNLREGDFVILNPKEGKVILIEKGEERIMERRYNQK